LAHGGLELQTCDGSDRTCAFVGADFGWAANKYTSYGFGLGDTTMSRYGLVGVIRAGLEVGSKRVRWRPGIEATVGDVSGVALMQSIAFRI
jgi:hypothetical protein